MIIDNISKISSLLKFQEGIFYYVQVIQRRKENPELPKCDMKRYQTFITSMEDLKIHLPRIKKVCEDFNARAYISLVPKSLEKLAKQCALEYVKRINSGEYKRVWDIPNRLALSYDIRVKIPGEKPYWMFDVDNKEDKDPILEFLLKNKVEIVDTIETPNGCHIVVKVFNPKIIDSYKDGDEDYVLPGEHRFTFRPDCNTILYASIPEILITE